MMTEIHSLCRSPVLAYNWPPQLDCPPVPLRCRPYRITRDWCSSKGVIWPDAISQLGLASFAPSSVTALLGEYGVEP